MTALALANATIHATLKVVARIFSPIRSAIVWFLRVNAEARIHRARLESEMYLHRYRLRSKSDDDLPVIL